MEDKGHKQELYTKSLIMVVSLFNMEATEFVATE
jgi:hypothetical protein